MGFFDDLSTGFAQGLTSPNTILGGLQLIGAIGSKKDAAAQQQAQAQATFDQQLQLLNAKGQQEAELLRLKASLSGGGGGGGGSGASMAIANAELAFKRKELAQQKALARYDSMRRGKETELSATMDSAKLKQDAMQNLLMGATSPLLRG